MLTVPEMQNRLMSDHWRKNLERSPETFCFKTDIKTLLFVLEAPRDHGFVLGDHITDDHFSLLVCHVVLSTGWAVWLVCCLSVCVTDSSSSSSMCVQVSYGDLYVTLCRTLHLTAQQTTLLLYMLLHRVDNVRAFVLSRANIDHLVCICCRASL